MLSHLLNFQFLTHLFVLVYDFYYFTCLYPEVYIRMKQVTFFILILLNSECIWLFTTIMLIKYLSVIKKNMRFSGKIIQIFPLCCCFVLISHRFFTEKRVCFKQNQAKEPLCIQYTQAQRQSSLIKACTF